MLFTDVVHLGWCCATTIFQNSFLDCRKGLTIKHHVAILQRAEWWTHGRLNIPYALWRLVFCPVILSPVFCPVLCSVVGSRSSPAGMMQAFALAVRSLLSSREPVCVAAALQALQALVPSDPTATQWLAREGSTAKAVEKAAAGSAAAATAAVTLLPHLRNTGMRDGA